MDKNISVITVNYNNASGLEKTINSVICQTYSDFEFLIIDGGSTDGSFEIIKKYNKYLSYWCSESDDGIYNAMNKGVSFAKGDYVIFLNSGDCFHNPNVLQEVSLQLGDKDIVVGYALKENNKIHEFHEENVLLLFLHGSFSHQATFIRRSLFKNYKYNENLKIVSDWEAWIYWVIFMQKSYKYINTIIADYDFNGISSDSQNWQRILEERRIVLSEKFPPLVLKTLQECDDIYLRAHLKYIKGFPMAERVTIFIVKAIAYICKIAKRKK